MAKSSDISSNGTSNLDGCGEPSMVGSEISRAGQTGGAGKGTLGTVTRGGCLHCTAPSHFFPDRQY